MIKDKLNKIMNDELSMVNEKENSQFTTHNSPLPKGYKNTEIGVIPDDWEVKNIGCITDVDPDNLNSSTRPEYNFKYISLEDVDNGILRSISEITFKNAPSRARRKIKKNDVLVSTVRPNLKSHLHINENVENWVCSTGFAVLRSKFNITNSHFVFNHFFTFIINNQINNLITGSNYPAISNKEVKSLKIPLPPLPEQTAIATVLSDTDSLIQALEKKIAKKQLIKKGVMQKMLSPKEGWEVKTLGEIAYFSNGKAHEQFIENDAQYIVINSKFVSTQGGVFKTSSVNLSPLKKGDVAMVMSDIPNGKALAKCFLVPEDNKYALNQRICSLRAEKVDNVFLSLILNRNKYYLSFDSGTGQTNLKRNDVLNCPIPLPPTLEEQNRIAQILSDMDSEIETLQKKLAKYTQIKQGLMQVLLTGKIRLV